LDITASGGNFFSHRFYRRFKKQKEIEGAFRQNTPLRYWRAMERIGGVEEPEHA
jgi:hypothetical protein